MLLSPADRPPTIHAPEHTLLLASPTRLHELKQVPLLRTRARRTTRQAQQERPPLHWPPRLSNSCSTHGVVCSHRAVLPFDAVCPCHERYEGARFAVMPCQSRLVRTLPQGIGAGT